MLEKLLVEIVPAEGKAHVGPILDAMFESPGNQYAVCIRHCIHDLLHSNDTKVSIAAMNGLLTGINMIKFWNECPDMFIQATEGFLDWRQKERGENIIDFFKARAGK